MQDHLPADGSTGEDVGGDDGRVQAVVAFEVHVLVHGMDGGHHVEPLHRLGGTDDDAGAAGEELAPRFADGNRNPIRRMLPGWTQTTSSSSDQTAIMPSRLAWARARVEGASDLLGRGEDRVASCGAGLQRRVS
jgi:hypothetical protein